MLAQKHHVIHKGTASDKLYQPVSRLKSCVCFSNNFQVTSRSTFLICVQGRCRRGKEVADQAGESAADSSRRKCCSAQVRA